MTRKKYAFTLVEILITFVLAGILFGCVFSNFFQMGKLQNQIDEVHAIVLNRQLAQLKLYPLFARLPVKLDETNDETIDCPIYTSEYSATKSQALWLTLTMDCASDRRFIGPITYCLYHDEKQKVVTLQVRNQNGEEKSEEIMHHIERCKILLFDPQKKIWTSSWPKNKKSLPTMLKLEVVEKGRKEILEFAYTLPASQQIMLFTP